MMLTTISNYYHIYQKGKKKKIKPSKSKYICHYKKMKGL